MYVNILRERAPFERRTAMVPEVAPRLINQGHVVSIESGAGEAANYSDDLYRERSVIVVDDPDALLTGADVLCTVAPPLPEQVTKLREGAAIVGLFQPGANLD